jgi:hypothetical protein
MLNKKVTKQHIIEALKYIDRNGVPKKRQATKFNLYYDGRSYPPKYVLSIATRFASGKELEPSVFNGGKETNSYLSKLGFIIREGNNELKKKLKLPRILRLALKTEYNVFNNDGNLTKAFIYLARQINESDKFDYLVTPGGFLNFEWPKQYSKVIKDQIESQKLIPILKSFATKALDKFWFSLPDSAKAKIKSSIKYITFGIDSENGIDPNNYDPYDTIQCIQFVVLFDTSKEKIIHWTGKSYPTTIDQKMRLIEFSDLKSHFKKVNGEMVCLLGCHDLNIFSPRAKAVAAYDRQIKIKTFDKLMRHLKPTLIIQHPHNTDTYKIWYQSWKTVEKIYPFVKEYVSGIRYYNYGDSKRGSLKSVLDKTIKGDIKTIVY